MGLHVLLREHIEGGGGASVEGKVDFEEKNLVQYEISSATKPNKLPHCKAAAF